LKFAPRGLLAQLLAVTTSALLARSAQAQPEPVEVPPQAPGEAAPSPLAGREALSLDPNAPGPETNRPKVPTTVLLAAGLQAEGPGDALPCEPPARDYDGSRLRFLPGSLLWEVPYANQREPRMFGKVTDFDGTSTYETALGAQIGLVRWGASKDCHEGIQLDIFGVAFSRFRKSDLLATDYRVGLPLTFAAGSWQAKVALEHSSGHVGDELLKLQPNFPTISYFRDEVVLGLAYRFADQLRVYGQVGWAFHVSDPLKGHADRYDLGFEWSRQGPTSRLGQPFVAVDLDLRSEQDYEANTTVQVGWQWRYEEHRHSVRVALEWYDGRSPYGQFFLNREDWVGFGVYYDW
jgi:hypothetical protein